MSIGELFTEIVKKLVTAVIKFILFFVFVMLSAVEILTREINGKLRKYLFPNRK